MKSILTLLLVYSELRCQLMCLEKRWTGNVDWDVANNWLGGSVPTIDSQVIFPLEMRHAVGLPPRLDQQRLMGMKLPNDGLVALPEDGKILVAANKGHFHTAVWLRETPFFWLDPDNWHVESEAVPHMERLPCQSDVVVLPSSSRTFSAKLPVSRDVEVQAVRLENENSTMARWEWRALRDKAEFLGSRFSVSYGALSNCKNCPCQEGDISDYWEEVCNVQRPKCGPQACEYPLKVEGHCCHYCGGRVRFSKKTLLSSATRVARNILAGYEKSLSWHSRQTSDGFGEILIAEKGVYSGSNVVLGVADVEAALREQNIELLSSETSGGPFVDHRLTMALAPFLGSFALLVLLVILVFPAFGYTYSQVWDAAREVGSVICIERRVNGHKRKSFAFARFENLFEGNVQLAEEEQEEEQASSAEQSSGGETFENPLYRHEKAIGKERKLLDTSEPVSLIALEKVLEVDNNSIEDIEMDIENL
ncbi:protein amnionless-like [Nasonia vitripennis]|uniref:Protein amnionless n=1 Tax=Nasonia vitripennis TaxID=7425 RepID=A0A7M7LJF2_NASVI|nr:protein amnionless-like [Nasonia vitripennis]